MSRNQIMNQSLLLSQLAKYHPTDPYEISCKEQIITFVNQHPDCFERTLRHGHITGSCWLLSKDLSKALIMHHAKLDIWVQPGGHCDGNPDVLAVAIKEAQEESGIEYIVPVQTDIFDLDIHMLPAHSKEAGCYHYDVRFLLKVASDNTTIQNEESKELRWIGKNRSELPTNEESVVRLFNKWIALT